MVQRCLETDGLGYEVFNVANADMSVAATTDEVRERFYDGVELRRPMGRNETFYSIDKARDLGQMVQRCLETDGLGYEVFNVANHDMSVAATTQEVRERFYDDVEVRREMGRDETFYAIDKARDLLGFAPRHSWRDVLADPGHGHR